MKKIEKFKSKKKLSSKEKMRSIDDKLNFKKNMIISDLHIPYQDKKAVDVMYQYGKKYKPDNIVINGDLLDFYRLSTFDQSPERVDSVPEEVEKGKEFIREIRKKFKDANIYFIEGNHEQRLQRYLWRNPELHGLDVLKLDNLLEFKKSKIKYIKTDGDYWGKDTGHLKIGDLIIMHGDNRLNGASTSRHAGYSASNTMRGIQQSVAIGHIHRLALVKQRTPYGDMTGVEVGCLCEIPGNANWQQGFVTFETYKGKNSNYRLHEIKKGELIVDGKIFKKS